MYKKATTSRNQLTMIYHHLKTETCFDSKYKKQRAFGDPRSAATVKPLNSCVSNISQSTESENIPGIL